MVLVVVTTAGVLIGTLAGGRHGPRQVRAATVAGAAAATGLEFGGRLLAVLDGGLVTTDGQLPLAAGEYGGPGH